jgi:hypothetical protein
LRTVVRKNSDKMESSGERKKGGATGEHYKYSTVNRGSVKGIRREDWNIGCRKEESESIILAEEKKGGERESFLKRGLGDERAALLNVVRREPKKTCERKSGTTE